MLPTAYFLLSALALRDVIFFFQAEDGIRDLIVTGVQTCALPIYTSELQSRSDLVCRLLLVTGVQTCRSEEHTSELQSRSDLVCRLLLDKKKTEPGVKPEHAYHT